MLEVFKFFSDDKTNDYTLAKFRADWAKLSKTDADQLKAGIQNGTLTY